MPTVYVFAADNTKYESLTKEQIITAITQEMETRQISDVDTGFVTTIKEQNHGAALKVWIGTQAEYNALQTLPEDTMFIITDDTSIASVIEQIEELTSDVTGLNTTVENIVNGTTTVPNATHAASADSATRATSAGSADFADEATGALSAGYALGLRRSYKSVSDTVSKAGIYYVDVRQEGVAQTFPFIVLIEDVDQSINVQQHFHVGGTTYSVTLDYNDNSTNKFSVSPSTDFYINKIVPILDILGH